MKKYRGKIWNDEVFEKYMITLPSTKENSLINNGLFTNVSKYRSRMNEQTGGNYIVEPIKGRLEGDPLNYDGETDAKKGEGRDTFYQGKVCFGRMQSWGEYDFPSDLTGTNFKPEAQEVKNFWDEYKQKLTLLILKGIFAMSDKDNNNFASKHTYEVNGNLTSDGANRASQKALGDKKAKFDMVFMHSAVSTNLEGLNQIEFLKYTDASGVTRDLTIGTWNGKLVVVDDDMPVEHGYAKADAETPGAKQVKTSGASGDNEINQADVQKGDFYPEGLEADTDYVVEQTKYTSYMFQRGFFEFEDIGLVINKAEELARDPYDKGGRNDLITRRRWAIVPKFISFTKPTTNSPSNEELVKGANWAVANNNETSTNKKFVDDKLIPVVRIISLG